MNVPQEQLLQHDSLFCRFIHIVMLPVWPWFSVQEWTIETQRLLCALVHAHAYIYIYTECPRRNVPKFGRVFLRLKYTDITQNTYIQSWTVTEIMARENCGLLAVPRTVPAQLTQSAGQVQYTFSQRPTLLVQLCSRLIPKCAVSKR